MSKYDKFYIIRKLLLLKYAKKNSHLQKLSFFAKFSKNVSKKYPKNYKIYIFENPLIMPF